MKRVNRFLLVESDFIYPPNHGGRVDAWNRIVTIHEMNGYIHLICTVKEKPRQEYIDIVNKYVNKLTLVYRKNRIRDMFYKRPLQMVSRKGLRNILLNEEYDYLVLEGSYVFDIIDNKTLNVKHRILRMHNDEQKYFMGLGYASSSIAKKIYYFLESMKFRFVDESLIRNVPNVMFISHDEMKRYNNRYSWINGCFLPTAVSLNFRQRDLKGNRVLMIGSLFMVNNQEAIKFYIQKVHPLLMDIPNYTLVIAGNSRGESIEWLNELMRKFKNIEFYNSPEDLEDLYANASVFVNTMINGAGVKLKTVNAIIQGLPVVATSVGNEGTGLVPGCDIFVADEAREISEYIRMLLNDKTKAEEVVRRAQEYLEKNYNQKKVLARYLNDLSKGNCNEKCFDTYVD